MLLPISLRLPAGALNAKPLVLRGEVRALVCREVCIPGRAQVSLSLPVRSGAPAANPEVAALFSRAEPSLPVNMPSSWRPSATQTGDQILLNISGTSLPTSAVFFPGSAGQVEYAATQRSEQRGADFRLSLVRPRDAKGPLGTLEGILRLPPGSSPAAYLVRAEVSQEPPAPGGTGPSPDNLLVMTLFAFAGGLILNLMPCVFPVLSLKAVSLLKAADQGDLGIRRNALIYVAGVFVSFYSLVGLSLILRAGGNTLGWGFQLQSPGFVAFLACLLFAMGLNLAGVFEVGQSILGIGGSMTQSGGWTASFFTGVLACQVNERVAFQSAEVQDRLRRARIRLLRADWTSYDAEVTRQLSAYGRGGVPLYVLYGKPGIPLFYRTVC